MKTIGIVAHSAEGGALCFITACRQGEARLGPHMHPTIVLSAVPMGLSMPGWDTSDHDAVAAFLRTGVEQVASARADFYICPENSPLPVLDSTRLLAKHAVREALSDRALTITAGWLDVQPPAREE